jgi:glycosyltransferase involved in cell wall biosynthesis
VLASRIGGLPELIDDGVNGLLFNLDNLDEAAEKATALLRDATVYRSVSDAAVETANTRFAMSRILDQYEAVYGR